MTKYIRYLPFCSVFNLNFRHGCAIIFFGVPIAYTQTARA
jgi:hypothetical protein